MRNPSTLKTDEEVEEAKQSRSHAKTWANKWNELWIWGTTHLMINFRGLGLLMAFVIMVKLQF